MMSENVTSHVPRPCGIACWLKPISCATNHRQVA